MRNLDIDIGVPKTRRELYLRVHRDRGLEWGLRRR